MFKSKGFTLIELIIVIVFFGIIASIFSAGLKGCTDQSPHAQDEAKQFATEMFRLSDVKVSCMNVDTNHDGYVSCTVAGNDTQGRLTTVPIECATDTLLARNNGCRAVTVYR